MSIIRYTGGWTLRCLSNRPVWTSPWKFSPESGLEKGLWYRSDTNGACYYVLPDGSVTIHLAS